MINDLLQQSENNFKRGDRVRVLKNDTPDGPNPTWKTHYCGAVIKAGTHFALIIDPVKGDGNLGTLNESVEWTPYNSKMLKIIKN